jgi:NADPH-dependent curcumin reductase CurA
MPPDKQILLAARPMGLPKPSDFKLVESAIPQPGPGEFLVRALYVSVDPYMRGRMNDVKSYAPPLRIGEVMGSGSVGKVINSQNSQCKEKTRASNWCA